MYTITHPNWQTSWILKGCPRCEGDLFCDINTYSCLQCGYVRYGHKPLPYVRPLALVEKNSGEAK